jgi:hypothetical protein
VFVSSTYYDLKHIRASLENFIDALGYEAMLSEKGSIAYTPDAPLDESCYREVRNADVFVLIIGGRYGTEKSETKGDLPKGFFEKYDSITKTEYSSAVEKDIPVYILIERAVYAEYQTYLRNKDNQNVKYAHVDSANVFSLIEEILAKRRNNPMQQFDRYSDIESWLREQWAGLFRELLTRMSSQKQISSLASQVEMLTEMNKTLKAYLEKVMSEVAPNESKALIDSESERLDQATALNLISANSLTKYLAGSCGVPAEKMLTAVREAESWDDLVERISKAAAKGRRRFWENFVMNSGSAISDEVNDMRGALGLPTIEGSQGSTPSVEKVGRKGSKG